MSMPGSADPVVKMRIRDAGDPLECETAAGLAAPFNTRAAAAIIDVVVAGGLVMTATWMLPFLSRLGWLLGAAYMVSRDTVPFLGGQSVGKKAMKLKALTMDDQSLVGNWQVAFIRNGILMIPFFSLIELFVLLTREDKPERGRRLGDEWAKTKVVIAPIPPAAENSQT